MEEDGCFLISGGILRDRVMKVTVEELRSQFPNFASAAVSVFSRAEELAVALESVDDLLGCVAASFSEEQPKRKRFQVYREISLVLGYAERTALPLELELAVKLEFSVPGEVFTGFKE